MLSNKKGKKMKSGKYICIVISVIALLATEVVAAERNIGLQCGGANISVGNTATSFLINVVSASGQQQYRFKKEKEFLFLRCMADKKGKEMLLINNFCSGSHCIESNFTIINPSNLETILQPNPIKGNHREAEKILGKSIASFDCEHYSGRQLNADYCFSALP